MNERHPQDPAAKPTMARLNRFAWLLDNSIRVPGTRYRIGLDPLIGLIPGIGDAIGALLSLVIVGEALRARLPASILLRMAFNVALEVTVGAVPIVGDIFDMTWKANARNARLMERYLESSRPTVAASRAFLIAMTVMLLVVLAAAVVVGFLVLRRLWHVLVS